MLHFNQRNWFRMFPTRDDGDIVHGNDEPATSVVLPEPRNRKEFYLSLLAGHTPTKKKVLFSGYGEFSIIRKSNICEVAVSIQNADTNVTVMLGDRECSYAKSFSDWQNTEYSFTIVDDNSRIAIHVSSEADAASKVVIFKPVGLTPPQPKTATEFYLAKMAGVEIATYETVLERELTFVYGGRNDAEAEIGEGDDNYAVHLSKLLHSEQCFMDGVILDANTVAAKTDTLSITRNNTTGMIYFVIGGTSYASYVGTTHTIKFIDKTVIENVPVKTRTEQYLKAIAANKDSSADDNGAEDTPVEGGIK